MRKTAVLLALVCAAGLPASAPAASVFIAAENPALTAVATLTAGVTYELSAIGVADLYQIFNGGLGLTVEPNGIPTYAFPAPYDYFNPGGSPVADGNHGPAYYSNLGALVGTFSAAPAIGPSSSDFFLIGSGILLTPVADVTLYALINDSVYDDNEVGSGFTLTVDALAAVPEPASWAMLVGGFAMVGGALRTAGRASPAARTRSRPGVRWAR